MQEEASSENVREEGPGLLYDEYAKNELVAEKLKLLNYEDEFIPLDDSFKIVPRHYFVHSTNVGEQFHLFTSLCTWLIRKAGLDASMEMPTEFDDPNMTVGRIVDALKSKGVDVPFPASKMKPGAGPQCLYVLQQLTEMALDQNGFRFGMIKAAEEEVENDHGQIDEVELLLDQYEDEVEMAEDEDDPGAEAMDRTEELTGGMDSELQDSAEMGEPLKEIMWSNSTEAGRMQEELSRVTPQLKITIRANMRDWRMHVEQMHKLENTLNEQYTEVKPFLVRTGEEIEQALERIRVREHHLNEQFADLLQLYRSKQNELAAISEQYKESSGTLGSRTETLNLLGEEIDQLKMQIEEQGTQNTSGAPILKIKQAVAKMEKDIFIMRVQTTALEQTLMQTQLADHINTPDFINYTAY